MKMYEHNGYSFIYKKKKTHKKILNFYVAIVLTIAIVVVGLISGSGVKRNRVIYFASKSYYGVQIGGYTTYETAKTVSEFIVRLGGSGTIVTDKSYRVLAMVYVSEKDAESVIEKLKINGMNARVYEVEMERKSADVFCSIAEKNNIELCIAEMYKCIDKLLEISVLFDKGEESRTSAGAGFENASERQKELAEKLSFSEDDQIVCLRKCQEDLARVFKETAEDVTGGNIKAALTECVLIIKGLYEEI